MGHQLEYVKIMRQTTMQPYLRIVTEIWTRRGIAGFWDGFMPWGAVQATTKGAVFGYAHAVLNNVGRRLDLASPSLTDTMCGAGAGGIQGLVLSPLLLLKTRVMTDPSYSRRASMPGASATVESFRVGLRVLGTEGVFSLFKGAGTFAAKRVGDWGSRYAFTNAAEDAMRITTGNQHLGWSHKIAAALVGGTASALATIPIDVMVANIQSASSAGKSVGAFAVITAQFKAGGFEALAGFATRGFLPRCLHVAFTTLVVRTGTAYVEDLLDPPPRLSH